MTDTVEKKQARSRKSYEKNREAVLARTAKYQANNREQSRQYSREWYARNREAQRLRAEIKNRRVHGLPEPTRIRPDNCECCGLQEAGRLLALDHCHETGAFRGWLCATCNMGLGQLGDTVESLERALAYIKRSK